MSRVDYSIGAEADKMARAMIYEVHISPKHALEICRELKGMHINEAKSFLEDVVAMKKVVPFKRHKKDVSHKRGLNKWYAGQYPKKAAAEILQLIANARSNAEYKGLDPERMRIKHIAIKKGRVISGMMPRAMGRATAKDTETVTVELVIEEVE